MEEVCFVRKMGIFTRSRSIFVSKLDEDDAIKSFNAERTTVVENGVDCGYFSKVVRRPIVHRLLILGSLFWRPNLDGIRQFLEHALPIIKSKTPNIEVQIVGRLPPAWLAKYVRQFREVSLHADVPDVRSYLAEAGMLVVPLRVGGGSRLKILEAAASGVPVVSTLVGAEGLELDDRHFFPVKDIAGMGTIINSCVGAYDECLIRAGAAKSLVARKYDWDFLAAKLDQVWRSTAAGLLDVTPSTSMHQYM